MTNEQGDKSETHCPVLERESIVALIKAHRTEFHGFLNKFDRHVDDAKRVETKVDTLGDAMKNIGENVSYLKELSSISSILSDMKTAFGAEVKSKVEEVVEDVKPLKNGKSVPLVVFIIVLISFALFELILFLQISGYSLETGGDWPFKLSKHPQQQQVQQ